MLVATAGGCGAVFGVNPLEIGLLENPRRVGQDFDALGQNA